MYPRTRIAVRSIIAILQLIGGLFGLWIVFGLGDGRIWGAMSWFVLAFLASITGAVLLWRSPYLGILVSMAVQSVQIPLIETPSLTYRLGIGTGLWFQTAPFQLSRYAIGTNYSYSRSWGSMPAGPSYYGVNVAALMIFGVLLVLLRMRTAESRRRTQSVAAGGTINAA